MSPSAQRPLLDQDGRDRTAGAIEARLDHVPLAGAVRVGLELQHLGLQRQHLEQLVDALLGLGRDVDVDGLAAPLLGDQPVLGQLVADALGVGARLVDLVDRDDDRHAGLLGVVDRLDGLRHHAVVGGDHQHDDVGHLGAAGAHRGERLVARRVEEDDVAPVRVNLVGADVLGDAAGLARGDVGLADGVEQRRLAVVDVTHDGDDRRARHQILGRVLGLAVGDDLVLVEGGRLDLDSRTRSRSASRCRGRCRG